MKKKWVFVLGTGAYLGFWVASFTTGKWIGKRYSPHWEERAVTKSWIATRLSYKPDSPERKNSGTYSIRCEAGRYEFRPDSDSLKSLDPKGTRQNMGVQPTPIAETELPHQDGYFNRKTFESFTKTLDAYHHWKEENSIGAMILGIFVAINWGFETTYRPAPSSYDLRQALLDLDLRKELIFAATIDRIRAMPFRLLPSAQSRPAPP